MGYITKDTYTFRTLDSFYKRLTDADDAELMIHDSVSLVGLEEIWTASERLYSKVVDMVPEDLKSKVRLRSEIPDQIYESFTDLTSKQLTRIGIDTDIEPNFCYWIGGRYPVDTQRRDSMHNMDKLLANCQAKLSYRDDPKSSSWEKLPGLVQRFHGISPRPPPTYSPENYEYADDEEDEEDVEDEEDLQKKSYTYTTRVASSF